MVARTPCFDLSRIPCSIPGSLVQLDGLNDRNKVMTHYVVTQFRLLSDPGKYQQIFIVCSERSPPYHQGYKANRYPANVPEQRWVIVSGRLRRVGLMAPEELLAGQQMSFGDLVGDEADKFLVLVGKSRYIDCCKVSGNSFHIGSCGHFVLSVLLLLRLRNLGEPLL